MEDKRISELDELSSNDSHPDDLFVVVDQSQVTKLQKRSAISNLPVIQIPDLSETGEVGKIYQLPDGSLYTWNGSEFVAVGISGFTYSSPSSSFVVGMSSPANFYSLGVFTNPFSFDTNTAVSLNTDLAPQITSQRKILRVPYDCRLTRAAFSMNGVIYEVSIWKVEGAFLTYINPTEIFFRDEPLQRFDVATNSIQIKKDEFICVFIKLKGSGNRCHFHLTFEKS